MRSFVNRHQRRSSYFQKQNECCVGRQKKLYILLIVAFGFLTLRLAYWQILQHENLTLAAESQYRRTMQMSGNRGSIKTSDDYILAVMTPVYKLFIQPNLMKAETKTVADKICDVIKTRDASQSAQICDKTQELATKKDSKWLYLVNDLSAEEKKLLSEQIQDPGVGFEEHYVRYYPEASMAGQIIGFLGKDTQGEDQGYFGIEGMLDKELRGKKDSKTVLTDARGYQLTPEGIRTSSQLQGSDITLTIRRDVQHLVETYLQEAMVEYGAEKGEVLVMDPQNGNILALAISPSFNPADYAQSDPQLYKNPAIMDTYEPGSTFKLLTVAAGLDAGLINPETTCPKCSGPRVFGKYTIKTWNDIYHPNITMKEALAKSDNTAMIYIAELLGSERLKSYIEKFYIGQPTGLELQGDTSTPFPQKWGPVETATISFGQGISTTSMQLLRAVATIANDGKLVHPHIVKREDQENIDIQNQQQIISETSAKTMKEMMEYAARKGEAQWIYDKKFRVAGKTGTSQVAIQGGYDKEKTIASFIGFSPPEEPKFVMLVKLVAPQSSPWAAETAAPLWYKIASSLYLMLGIPYETSTAEEVNE